MSGANPGNPSGGIGFIDSVQAADEHTYQEEVVLDQAKDGKHAITHVEDGPEFSKEEYDLNQDIADAENVQRGMTIKEAIRNYYPSILWSSVACWTILMEGYGSPSGSYWVLEPFLEKYGFWSDELQKYYIPADWQMAIGEMSSVGCIFGVVVASWQCDKTGFRWSMITNMILYTGFVGMMVFSPNIKVLLASNLCMGYVWGSMSMMAVTYASEITPIQLRSYMTSFIQLVWTIGGLIDTTVVNAWLVPRQDQVIGYMLPWALQWLWPVPLITGMLFAPESPWWLTRKGRIEEAEKAINRLYAGSDPDIGRKTVAMMIRTDELEKQATAGARFRDCFRGVNFRRTQIACMAFSCQILCGAVLSWNSTFFFVQAGLPTTAAFRFGLGQSGIALVGVIIAWFLMSRVGRRKIFLFGLSGMASCLLAMGFCAVAVDHGHKGALWGQAAFLLLWVGIYGLTIGPVAFTVVSECSSTQLRSKTVGLGRLTFDILAIPAGIINPYMINATAWNWGGKTAFFWSAPCILICTWCYFYLPEFKDRSYREIDILFENGVPARKFSTTVVNVDDDIKHIAAVNSEK